MKRKPRETKRERKGRVGPGNSGKYRSTWAWLEDWDHRRAREIQCGPSRREELGIDHLRRNVDLSPGPGWQLPERELGKDTSQ